jgi:chromosome segregation ATPase
MTLQDLIAQYGIPIAIAIWAVVKLLEIAIAVAKSRVKETEVETKKDNTYIDFSVMFNDERRVLQERLDNERRVLQERLDAERKAREEQEDKFRDQFAAINEERAYEKGKLEQIEKTYDRERTVRDTKITNLEGRINELEKQAKQYQAKNEALEADILHKDALLQVERQKNEALHGEISELKAQVDHHKAQESYHSNRADTLSKMVEKLNQIDEAAASQPPKTNAMGDNTQGIPERVWDEAVEDTITPLPEEKPNSAAAVAAEETKP